jgi:hypothetical protein
VRRSFLESSPLFSSLVLGRYIERKKMAKDDKRTKSCDRIDFTKIFDPRLRERILQKEEEDDGSMQIVYNSSRIIRNEIYNVQTELFDPIQEIQTIFEEKGEIYKKITKETTKVDITDIGSQHSQFCSSIQQFERKRIRNETHHNSR